MSPTTSRSLIGLVVIADFLRLVDQPTSTILVLDGAEILALDQADRVDVLEGGVSDDAALGLVARSKLLVDAIPRVVLDANQQVGLATADPVLGAPVGAAGATHPAKLLQFVDQIGRAHV